MDELKKSKRFIIWNGGSTLHLHVEIFLVDEGKIQLHEKMLQVEKKNFQLHNKYSEAKIAACSRFRRKSDVPEHSTHRYSSFMRKWL